MKLLDRLFGNSRTGWLKTALLSGLLGIFISGLIYGEVPEGETKYYFILFGYPVLIVLKHFYWKYRADNVLEIMQTNDPNIEKNLESIKEWKPDVYEEIKAKLRVLKMLSKYDPRTTK